MRRLGGHWAFGFLLWLALGAVAVMGYRLDAGDHPVLWGLAAAPLVLLVLGAVVVIAAAILSWGLWLTRPPAPWTGQVSRAPRARP